MDCWCGRNWAKDPIQGNSDLWVITSNVPRRRAVSGCLCDSISHTQSRATHSLALNCPICFRHGARLPSASRFSLRFALRTDRRAGESIKQHLSRTHMHTQAHKVLCVLLAKQAKHTLSATHNPRSPPSRCRWHSPANLHLNSPTVGCTFRSITSFPLAECHSKLTLLCSVLLVYSASPSWQEAVRDFWTHFWLSFTEIATAIWNLALTAA